MGGGDQHAQLSSVTMADKCRTVGTDRIHHCADVVHPFLQRRQVLDRVRQPDPAHVEEDQPPVAGEPAQESFDLGFSHASSMLPAQSNANTTSTGPSPRTW